MPVISLRAPMEAPGHAVTFGVRQYEEDGVPMPLYRFYCSCGRQGRWHDTLIMARQRARVHLERVHDQ